MRTKTDDSAGSGDGSRRSCALVLALAVLAPAVAGAMQRHPGEHRPNGFAGQDTYGGKPTRLTWQASSSRRATQRIRH